ncbi:MAG: helix-turn-helix domain-containing protein [Chloroflexota bacterium]|nr:helix-turn-helix domain-containing protein [Chloroflexota bacterium]
MGGKRHPMGFCVCKHTTEHWKRPHHWTADEVSYLEQSFGHVSDERIAKHLARPVQGIRIKAKRLGLRKRDAGMNALSVAEIFAVDPHVVVTWIARGVLRGRRSYPVGLNKSWLIAEEAVEAFIRQHGEYVDVERMPDSWYRDLAEQHRWYSLVEVERLTGQSPHLVVKGIKAGRYHGTLRGAHWRVAAEELSAIRADTDPWRREHIPILLREREERLRRRRNRRKGVGQLRPAA